MRSIIVIFLILLLWLQYRLWDGPGSVAQVNSLQGELALQERELKRLTMRNQILEAEVLDLKNGLEALEEHARIELGMIRQGEVFYQIIGASPPAGDAPKSQATLKP